MMHGEIFSVGDQARTRDSNALLTIRDVDIRRGRTVYLVEDTVTMFGKSVGPWWASPAELQPPENS